MPFAADASRQTPGQRASDAQFTAGVELFGLAGTGNTGRQRITGTIRVARRRPASMP